MEEAGKQNFDRFAPITSSTGERVVELHNVPEQPLSPKDERIVSANPSPDAAISGASRNVKDQPVPLEKTGAATTVQPLDVPQEPNFYFGGFDGTGTWDDHSNYLNANNLHVVPPTMYNENPSLFFPPGYGYDTQMAYGQFSPIPSPMSTIMIDGQLYSPQQIPPPYFPPMSPGLPHVSSAMTVSQTDLMAPATSGQESLVDNTLFGPGSGYYLPFGSFGGGDLSGNSSLGFYKFPGDFGSGDALSNQSNSLESSRYLSPLTSGALYPQPIGILGSYEQSLVQAPYQGMGLGSGSSARHYPHSGSYQNMKYATGSSSHWERNRFSLDKGGRRDREKDSLNYSNDSLGLSNDRNRGPRASKPKGKNSAEDSSSSGINKDVESTSGVPLDQYNNPDFATEYENAKFFVIKSFSEDNVHKSIKYGVWASTPLGNRKLDAAYHEAKDMAGNCPVFLFFSVNASGQFCGIAEMVGPVDFEKDADYWQQDRWSGQFPVKWHVIKDVPNSRLRHILLENNDNKPVTHSRDSQEVKLEQGIEMLKIFKEYEADTSLLDDFKFYDDREKSMLEKKAKQKTSSVGTPPVSAAADPINQLSDNLADTLNLEGSKSLPKTEQE
ncbi:OLC1v1035746C1 [Oldenlandia corymbosa var. corymbosa]|uniref:YTH domain-containing family protein n=1 Tax=Oldenlandia corymbosa var. corymbosa TaxID=529605 RepID=A0AAV1CWX1_OLDCO|nr:OLC1v1035746C1 [Oldenlandia corymbosa var. corymbosa]